MTIPSTTKISDMGLSQESQKKGPIAVYVVTVDNLKMKQEQTEQDDYDPFQHGKAKHATSYLETLVHLFKGIVGTGILSLPAAFAQSGYLVGVVGVLLTTYFSTYCAFILARSEVELSRRRRIPSMSYQATAEAAVKDGPDLVKPLAPVVLHFCNFLLLVTQISSACVYLIFIAENIKAVTDVYVKVIDIRVMMLICSVPLLMVSSIKRLKYLAPFSTIGSLTVIASCGVVFYYMLQDVPPLSSRRPTGPVQELPQFLGTVFFAAGCISLILPLQNEMKSPSQFSSPLGVLNVGSVIVAILYSMFGFFGYLKFGQEAAGSVTLNLPAEHVSAQVVQVMLSVATLFGTTLSYYVAVTIIKENYMVSYGTKHPVLSEYAVRLTLVILTLLGAELIPNLELVVSLAGVFSHCTLATTLPCLIHIFTNYKKGSTVFRFFLFFGQDVLIILLTMLILISGLTANIKKAIALYV